MHGHRAVPGVRERRQQLLADLDDALGQALGDKLAERPQWTAFVKEIQKLVESGSVDPEGRFKACTQAYLRLMGGVRADKAMRIDLNAWQPMCRQHPTTESLTQHARSLMNGAAVTVANIHQAKGLEWDHVFVHGVADGVLPDFRAADQGSIDNERSLLYVAVTRARKRLWLCHAPLFGRQARRTFEDVSRFLKPAKVRKLMKARCLWA